MRTLSVCADDFGLDASATQAIVELALAERISATSVLVHAPHATRVQDLFAAQRRGACSIGLHFTLTEYSGASRSASLPGLVLRASSRMLRPGRVREALIRQLDRFEDLLGVAPEFLDGHEHVHQLPVVQSVVLDVLTRRYASAVAIRATATRCWRGAKARLIAWLGGEALARKAPERGLATNSDFAGVYRFDRPGRYRERMLDWLETLHDGGLLMCHPGAEPAPGPIGAARHEEYRYLRSADWDADLGAQGLRLVPFKGRVGALAR